MNTCEVFNTFFAKQYISPFSPTPLKYLNAFFSKQNLVPFLCLLTCYYSSAVTRNYIDFECERIWDADNYWFLFKFTWNLPPFILHDNAINGTVIIPRWIDASDANARSPMRINDMLASRFVYFPFEVVGY